MNLNNLLNKDRSMQHKPKDTTQKTKHTVPEAGEKVAQKVTETQHKADEKPKTVPKAKVNVPETGDKKVTENIADKKKKD